MERPPYSYGDVSEAFGCRPKDLQGNRRGKRLTLIRASQPIEGLTSDDDDPEPIKQDDMDTWDGLDLIAVD